MTSKRAKTKSNRLISEKSPYLLQHAYNPVDWYPWGSEAFERAKKEDKPIFLSIGYSTCHWCHVMEKESFEDPDVAKLMNEAFVNIKVDREERPDLDAIYMTVCQMMIGRGGWPLTIIMTPDRKPFFSATYIPKERRFGRIGMKELIPHIRELWRSKKEEAIDSAEKIVSLLIRARTSLSVKDLGETTLSLAHESLQIGFDEEYGGFRHAPKFPTPHNITFLLRYWKRSGKKEALEMAEKTLKSMRLGGIYDQIGFGFHRYSTDRIWLVPHFEKMLYDQAMLTMAYAEAYQATGKKEYRQTAREIITYVLRDMTGPEGGFYSAEDADSEGVEGKFYVWTEEEVRKVLTKEEADLVRAVYNVKKEGNFAEEGTRTLTGKNILHLKKSLPEITSELKIPLPKITETLESARQKLFSAREKRIHPHKDDKILTDWNGLMIVALARAAQALNEPEYLDSAVKAAEFILKKMTDSKGRLYHRYREGDAAIPAFIDDYVFFIWGLVEIYESGFEVKYLREALRLTEDMIKHFWDEGVGGFYFVADDGEDVLVRKKEIYDGAIPSGNSAAMLVLLRLSRMTGNTDYEDKAAQIARTFSGNVAMAPEAYTQLMSALDFAVGPSYELVIVGDLKERGTKAMLRAVRNKFIPNKVVLFRPAGVESPEIAKLAGFTGPLFAKNGMATAYVCKDYKCDLPTTDTEKMLELLGVKKE
ncbi:MAG: thioredoxin domain-containing protein [Candidatus Hodarchaeota archaeon]